MQVDGRLVAGDSSRLPISSKYWIPKSDISLLITQEDYCQMEAADWAEAQV